MLMFFLGMYIGGSITFIWIHGMSSDLTVDDKKNIYWAVFIWPVMMLIWLLKKGETHDK